MEFNVIWNLIVQASSHVWQQAGTFDLFTKFCAWATMVLCGLALFVQAAFFAAARFAVGVVIILSAPIIGCALFESTRVFTQNLIGKAVSLIIMQVAGIVILQILLTGDVTFLDQVIAHSGIQPTDEFVVLATMIGWFVVGAIAYLSLCAIAYSIGGGTAIGGFNAIANLLALRGAMALLGSGSASTAARAPNLSLSLPPRPIVAPTVPALPSPPPPPALIP